MPIEMLCQEGTRVTSNMKETLTCLFGYFIGGGQHLSDIQECKIEWFLDGGEKLWWFQSEIFKGFTWDIQGMVESWQEYLSKMVILCKVSGSGFDTIGRSNWQLLALHLTGFYFLNCHDYMRDSRRKAGNNINTFDLALACWTSPPSSASTLTS